MKVTICYDVPRHAVPHHIPRCLHGRLAVAPLTEAAYTLIAFAHTHVTTSRLVAKAIRRLAPERRGRLLVVGANFTAEGRELFQAYGAIVVTISDYHWTDASYQTIRSVTRTRARYTVPRPAPVVANEPPSRRPPPVHVYAVLRIDEGSAELADRINVKEVVTSAALAESEAARLNRLNGDKGCKYIVRLTRLYATGTSAGSNTR